MTFKQSRFIFLKTFFLNLFKKNKFIKTFFLNSFLFLFFGLFLGSLFGTFLDLPRSLGFWDGFIILFILFICEVINLFVYVYRTFIFKTINYLKIGFLLALFIDAFKVGS